MDEHSELDRLATELFRTFARAEYALKAAGWNSGEGDARANWTAFAKSVDAWFQAPASDEVRDAVDFLLASPPKKQVVVNGVLQWREVKPETNSKADLTLQYVRRVRNNLFHGGKFNGHWFEPERSELLLRHTLTVLRAVIEASPEVREAYFG